MSLPTDRSAFTRRRRHPTRTVLVLAALIALFASSAYLGRPEGAVVAVFGPDDFVRHPGAPMTESRTFSAADTQSSYTLRIRNGGQAGQYGRVSSAVVRLNGVLIAGPSDFNQQVGLIEKSVRLLAQNALTVELRSHPGSGVTIEILGNRINRPPVADAGPDQTTRVGVPAVLDGSHSSDPDGDSLTYSWVVKSAPAGSVATLPDASAPQPTLTPDEPGTYIIELTVRDATTPSLPDAVVVSTVNSAPVARAGADQTLAVDSTAHLDGSGSTDADGDALRYSWSLVTKPQGSAATIDDPVAIAPSFVVDRPGEYVAQLIVQDAQSASLPDTVTITTHNSAPVANAGPDQTTRVGQVVTLDGSGSSDVDRDALTYAWTLVSKPAGSNALLDGAAANTPTFRVDLPGTYIAQLVVGDGLLASDPDTVVITTVNSAPVGNAGPDQLGVAVGNPVALDGTSSSDADKDLLSSTWSLIAKPEGSTAALTDLTSPRPSFVPDLAGDYVAQLIVSDGALASAPDTVLIRTNSRPVVNAGSDQVITLPASAALEGIASDDGFPEGGTLSYAWSQISGPGAVQFGSPNSAATTVTFVAAGEYRLRLTVSDGNLSASEDVTVSVLGSVVNAAPVVSAGPDRGATVGGPISLQGFVTDDGLPIENVLTIGWEKVAGPGAVVFLDTASAQTDVTVSVAGTYILRLTASDGVLSSSDDVKVTVSGPECVPVPVGLVAWWPGNGTAKDIIGGHDGQIIRNVTYAAGVSSQAFNVPASPLAPGPIPELSTSYVAVPGAPALDMAGPFTIELWAQLRSVANQQYFVIRDAETNNGKDHNYELRVFGDTLPADAATAAPHSISFAVGDGNSMEQVFSTTTLAPGAWYHIAATYDGQYLSSYVNGALDSSRLIGPKTLHTSPASPLRLGIVREAGAYWYQLDGLMDEVSLYNRALSPAEVLAVYDAGAAGKCAPPIASVLVSNRSLSGAEGLFEYDGRTGEYMKTLVPAGSGGMAGPDGMAIGLDGQLYAVANDFANFVGYIGRYDRTTGSFKGPLVAAPGGTFTDFVFGPNGNIFASFWSKGAPIPTEPGAERSVREYDVTSGALVRVFADTGKQGEVGCCPQQLTFGPDGNLYVATEFEVEVFDGRTGEFIKSLATLRADGIAFAPNGRLFVSTFGLGPRDTPGEIVRVDTVTGAVTTVVPAGTNGLGYAHSLRFGPDGLLYAVDSANAQVLRFDAASGELVDVFIKPHSGGLDLPINVLLMPSAVDNLAPVVNAGSDQSIILPAAATLSGGASDDGLPNGRELVYAWMKISGLGDVIFASQSALTTTASFSLAGAYVLRLTANDGELEGFDEVTVIVRSPLQNAAPNVSAGPDATLILPLKPLPTSYALTLLPDLGGGHSAANSVNDVGESVGWASGASTRGVIWRDGKVVEVPGADAQVQALSINGQAAGLDGNNRFFIFAGGQKIDVGSQSCCYRMSANRHGDFVGMLDYQPALYHDGVASVLPVPSGRTGGHALAVNDHGLVVGTASFPGDQIPVRWLNGTVQPLSLGGVQTRSIAGWAYGVNNFGEIAGQVFEPDGQPRAALWRNGALQTLEPMVPSFINDQAMDINDRHQVLVQWQSNTGAAVRSWIWRSGASVELTPFIAPFNTRFILNKLNNRGQVSGYLGVNSLDPNQHAFVLTPTTVASTEGTIQLAGSASDDGLPVGSVTVSWTTISGPATVAFSDSHSATSTATFPKPGTYILRSTATDTALSVADDVTITVKSHPDDNEPPEVNAGPDQSIALSGSATLKGSASDDGWPIDGAITYHWWKLSGPGTVTFAQPTDAVTSATFSTTGTYVLRLVANDSVLSNADDVTIFVSAEAPNQPPVVSAGTDQTIQLLATAALAGSAVDDGLPSGSTLSYAWTLTSGPGPVVFADASRPITVASFSQLGSYTLRLTVSDSELSGFDEVVITVSSAVPELISVAPNSWMQGQSGSLTIIGSGTHFTQGLSGADLGAGVTVTSLAVNSPTSLTAAISVGPNAPTGSRAVTVVTGAETASLASGLVVVGLPRLVSIAPSPVFRGQTLQLQIKGQFTHFVPGITHVSLGTGIAVNSVTVQNDTSLTAQVTVDCYADLGGRMTSVATGPEVLSLPANAFSVEAVTGDMLVVSVTSRSILRFDLAGKLLGTFVAAGSGGLQYPLNPIIGPDGDLYVADALGNAVRRYSGLTGAYIDDFVPAGTGGLNNPVAPGFGPDGNLYITDRTAAVVRRYDGRTKAYLGVFNSGGDLVVPTTPVFGPDGNLYVPDERKVVKFDGITGEFISTFLPQGQNGLQGPGDIAFACDGKLYVGTSLSGVLRFDAATGEFIAPPFVPYTGVRLDGGLELGPNNEVYVGSFHGSEPIDEVRRYDSKTGSLIDTFIPQGAAGALGGFVLRRTSGPPALVAVSPNLVSQGQRNVTVTVSGRFTQFAQGATTASLGDGITVTSVTVTSPTTAKVLIDIDSAAATGPRTVTLTTDAEVIESSPNGFFVRPGAPVLTAISRVSAQQGEQFSLGVTGQFTHFAQGLTTVSAGPGVDIANINVTSPTALTALVTINAAASLGPRDVTVITGAEAVTKFAAFTIVSAEIATIDSVSPSSGPQGSSGPVAIQGLNTHFVEGVSVVAFGPGITVSNIQVTCPTCLTADLAVSDSAPIGPRAVTVTTGPEVVSLANGFTVQAGVPILTSLSRASGGQGQSFAVTITGRFTHFSPGITFVTLGPGVTVSNISVTNASSLSALVTIDPGAALGPRDLTVTTGSEVVTAPGVFSVTAAAVLTAIEITPATTASVVKGSGIVFVARGLFDGGSTQDPLPGVTWSATPAFATISQAGLLVGTGVGVAHVRASRDGLQSAETLVTIRPQVPQLLIPIVAGENTVGGAAEAGASIQLFVNGAVRSAAVAGADGRWSTPAFAPSVATADVVTAQQTVAGIASDLSPPAVVIAASPSLVSVAPASANRGTTVTLTLAGQNTHFVAGQTTLSLGAGGETVTNLTVTSATTLNATVSLVGALLGARPVTVTTGGEIVALPGGFTVLPSVNVSPMLTIDPAWTVTFPNRLLATYTVKDDGLPSGGALTVSWETLSGPGEVGYQDQTLTSISAGFENPGTYTLRVTATDTVFTVSRDIIVTVAGGVPVDAPVAILATPSEGSEITGPTDVRGTVSSASLASWRLEFKVDEGSYRTIATGTTPVANGLLGELDPTLFLNGIGYLRLSATDTLGTTTTTEPRTVVLTKNQKIGHFTVSFKDLELPLSGVMIQALRTYDSRNAAVGDFGVGWTLDVRNVRLRESGKVSLDWYGSKIGSGLSTRYCVQGTRAHVLTATLSDGTVYRFEPQLDTGLGFFSPAVPNCQPLAPIQSATLAFRQVSGPPATLRHIGTPMVVIQSAWPGLVELLDENTLEPVDFTRYTLTLPDGRVLTLNRGTGLEQLTDTNGNSLTVTAAGIFHSSGASVAFQRDVQGRITRMTDPEGHSLLYAYDDAGDLSSVTDQVGQVTTFTYDLTHRLVSIRDPRGIEPIRNEYDASGRLIRHVDGAGNTISYVHDIAGRREVVTDRLGNTTTSEFDADGNVTRVIDPLNGQTIRTYDSQGNVLTETDPSGHTRSYTYDASNNRLSESDALGNTTRYTYNALNRLETITDPLGRLTRNFYDTAGNLTSTRDSLGNVTSYTYDARGNRTSMTDPLGNATTYEVDAGGHVTREVDALGHVTTYTYDLNGNRRTETKTQTTAAGLRAVTTTFEFDAQNRLVRTVHPDGGSTQVTYNAIGKQATTLDPLGRETRFDYDATGRLVRTLYADGTIEAATYDAEGNRVSSTDRGGRIAGYSYDALKRLTRTTHPDGASEQTVYDAAGQVSRTIDARGNATQFGYDAAGRRTSVTDAMGHVTQFSYDEASNQRLVLDANGHLVQYAYDAANRRTRTTYQDGTFDEVTFDALGHAVSKRDQAGLVTRYTFDADGRLTRVTDALQQDTAYTYDELGNRLTQTDANSHTTRFEYDVMRRRVKRTLPLGMSETMTYDLAGNLKSKTDFNGKTTTYAYETNDRLTSKTPDPTLAEPTIRFTHTATGQRMQMVDASGTTNYTYDDRDRLKVKETPQGTLSYAYDLTGNLASIRSSNASGTSVDYAYDVLNRLSTVTDNRLVSGVTTYAYDDVGSLASYRYPNGVTHSVTYDPLNRLRDLTVASATSTLASYAYTLGPTGNRLTVEEFGGRRVDYAYDELYRLKSESITGGIGGTTTYTYDPVGNRKAKSSPATGLTNYGYDGNDRLTSDGYDANGNTTASGVNTYSYDFENHLTSKSGGVSTVYDGDGNRVAETVGNTTTRYLVDERNLTGYVQVLEELIGGSSQRVYTYGLSRISQTQTSGTSFYAYDGHGNVRLLTDTTGAVTDRYDYDGFGNIISQTGNTANIYLYSGEQNDPNLGLYYNRARYLNVASGRFLSVDARDGLVYDPPSLHRYLFTRNNPINRLDPTGMADFTLTGLSVNVAIVGTLNAIVHYNAEQAFSVVAKNFVIGGLEGGAFYATGVGAIRLLNYLGEAAKSTEVATLATRVLGEIVSRAGPLYDGLQLPKFFSVSTNVGEVFIKQNATEHLAELLAREATAAGATKLGAAVAIAEVKQLIETVAVEGLDQVVGKLITTRVGQYTVEIVIQTQPMEAVGYAVTHLLFLK